MKNILCAAVCTAILSVPAQAALYDISWTGSDNYALTGQLSFADSLLGTGAIDETDISTLAFDVFLGTDSQGSFSCSNPSGCAALNLNFDTSTEMF